MNPQELSNALDALHKDWVSADELAWWVVEEIAASPFLTSEDLLDIQEIPKALPPEILAKVRQILQKVSEVDYALSITTVGGSGIKGKPDNLRMAHNLLRSSQ